MICFSMQKEETEKHRQPDNIAVSIGENKYSKEESERFKEAIQQQISEQLSGYSDVTLTASGFQSGDNTVYLFTVAENDTGLITNQYYIVGEKNIVQYRKAILMNRENVMKLLKI